MIPISNPKK
jgi:hypothetical protein